MSDETLVETQETEQPQEIVQDPATEQTEIADDPQKINWANFRKARQAEREEKERIQRELQKKNEEAEAFKKAMEALVNQPTNTMSHNRYPEAEDLSDEDRIQKKVEELLEKKDKEREEKRRQEEHATYPQRLMKNYTDFSQVCSTENLDYLEFHYPEVAQPFALLPDGYEKWEAIYKAVKRFIPNSDTKKDAAKMEKNLQKPVALSRPGMTKTSDHSPQLFLTEEQRAKNWERMQRIMKSGS